MNDESVTAEIRKFISDKIAAGETVHVDWLTTEILNAKSEIEGDDLRFYQIFARSGIKRIVKQCIGKYDIQPITNEQLVLDGFDHLQVAYSLERHGDVVLVPVNQCTTDELLERAAEYDRMAIGCRDHARELRAYVSARTEAA